MADVDEDLMTSTAETVADDLEDETQDFRFLAQLTASSSGGAAIVPKRGTKDFEPNPTRSQASALDASRLAMHTALSAPRIHAERNHLVGQYFSNERQWKWEENDGVRRAGRSVVVYRFKSTHSKTVGLADRNNWIWLLPEEALYLLERGSLDIRWPDLDEGATVTGKDAAHDNAAVQGQDSTAGYGVDVVKNVDGPEGSSAQAEPVVGELPMSLQGAYASLIGQDGLTLERYSVYAGLKRSGYIVQRAPTWDNNDPKQSNGHPKDPSEPNTSVESSASMAQRDRQSSNSSISGPVSLIRRLCSWLATAQRGDSCPSLGPLVAPGLYRNYTDIFRALDLIPFHNPIPTPSLTPATPAPGPPPPFRIHLHAWKPNTNYKKSAPPPPDYRICVVDARSTGMPTLAQIAALLDSVPDDAVSKDRVPKLENRIKHGRRNVIIAVVDMGIVSYMRLSDACFGAERLFEQRPRGGAKGKGRGGGSGKRRSPNQQK